MTAEKHPHRCDTCGNTKSGKIGDCEYFHICLKTGKRIWGVQSNFTSIVGCASHSSAGEPAPEQKPCVSCRIPRMNENHSCCLDETNCMDIAKFEKRGEHDAAKSGRERVLTPFIELRDSLHDLESFVIKGAMTDIIESLRANQENSSKEE